MNRLFAVEGKCFQISTLVKAMRQIPKEEIEQEVRILKSHAIVKKPTHSSVSLERNFSEGALDYLKEHCGFGTDAAVADIIRANGMLID